MLTKKPKTNQQPKKQLKSGVGEKMNTMKL